MTTIREQLEQYRREKLDPRYDLTASERAALLEAEKRRLIDEAMKPVKAEQARWRADREAIEAQRRKELQDEVDALHESERVEMRRELEAAWLASGGDPKGFEDAWPDLERQEMTRRTLERRNVGRSAMARLTRSAF